MARRKQVSGPSTLSVHAGEENPSPYGAVTVPIYQSSTFAFPSVKDLKAYAEGKSDRYLYTRYGNPTLDAAERKMAVLESGGGALTFGSGMAAITTSVTTLAGAGDEVVAHRDLYGGTLHLFQDVLPEMGVAVRWFSEIRELPGLIGPRTRVVYFETPTNPALRVVDIERLVRTVRAAAVRKGSSKRSRAAPPATMIDSTFASPINQKPLELGVDVVVHSATKYLAGHSDLVAGVAVARKALIGRIRERRKYLGGILDPLGGFLLLRGLKTLALRVGEQNRSGLAIARFLSRHRRVRRVCYPFLPGTPGYAIARRQMSGGGGMVSLDLGSYAQAARFIDRLELFTCAPSLGGPESLATSPILTSHVGFPAAELRRAGVTPGLVRLSLGLEDREDLIEDLGAALR